MIPPSRKRGRYLRIPPPVCPVLFRHLIAVRGIPSSKDRIDRIRMRSMDIVFPPCFPACGCMTAASLILIIPDLSSRDRERARCAVQRALAYDRAIR